MIKINIREYGKSFINDLLNDLFKNPFVISADINKNIMEVIFYGSEVALRKDIEHFIITNNLCLN